MNGYEREPGVYHLSHVMDMENPARWNASSIASDEALLQLQWHIRAQDGGLHGPGVAFGRLPLAPTLRVMPAA